VWFLALVAASLAARPALPRAQSGEGRGPYLAAIWTTALPDAPAGTPAYDSERAYVPLRNGRLVAVALGSGAVEWSVDADPSPTLAAGDGLVFASVRSGIEARSGVDGSVAWRAGLDGNVSGALAWDQGWLIAVTGNGTAFALRARDGQTIWQKPVGASASVTPSVAADLAYLPLDDGRVQARRLITGDLVWERKLGGKPSRVLPLDDRLFVGANDHYFYCLAAKNGNVKWRWRNGGEIIGAPVVDERTVFFVSLDNTLRALDRGHGYQRWRDLLATRPSGGPLLFGSTTLLVAGIDAQVWAYRTKDGSLEGEVPTPDELAAPPHVTMAGRPSRLMVVVVTMQGQLQGLCTAPVGHPVQGLPLYLPLPFAAGSRPPGI
jgi:outer membrane protein assembly factor BamB